MSKSEPTVPNLPDNEKIEMTEKTEKPARDLVAYSKQYRAEHKDYYKNYYETNKAHILESMLRKVPCVCGCEIQQSNLKKHLRSPIHQSRLIKLQFNEFLNNQDPLGKSLIEDFKLKYNKKNLNIII